MEIIKSAGVYNCHIDDLYKSAEPAEAQSTALSTEPLHEELFAHLPGQGTGLAGAGHSPGDTHLTRIDLPITAATTTLSSVRDLLQFAPMVSKSSRTPLPLSMDAITGGLILATATFPVASG